MKSRKQKRGGGKLDLHFLNEGGMVACNPRDREAAHRAQMEDIATEDPHAVTCRKCWGAIVRTGVLRKSGMEQQQDGAGDGKAAE